MNPDRPPSIRVAFTLALVITLLVISALILYLLIWA